MTQSLFTPSDEPLTDQQLDYLDKKLLELGNDNSILGVSELDGFLTAIVSGPNMVPPSHWFSNLWGGEGLEPEWESQEQFQQFIGLVMQHMNFIAFMLMEMPNNHEAIFNQSTKSEEPVIIADEWCFGYMRGVDLDDWSSLPVEMETWLHAIELHGREHNFELLDSMTLVEHQQSIAKIEPAARKLHAFWLSQRKMGLFDIENSKFKSAMGGTVVRSSPKIGRNDPCACGSGKKYKKCCLH